MGDTNPEKSKENLLSRLQHEPDLASEPQPFVSVPHYSTFFVEYTIKGRDLVFHFFAPEGLTSPQYWRVVFPECLDVEARSFFRADRPILEASFIEGVQRAQGAGKDAESSWWLAAHGFATSPDPGALVEGFLDKLDQALDRAMAMKRA